MNLEDVERVYFIGIGGIGMSALARWFKASGIPVAGYDRTETELTRTLIKEGIPIHYEDNLNHVDDTFLNKENTLITYTPAIPSYHSELTYFKQKSFSVMKRSAVLGLITKHNYTIAVAGTHGKTTTVSMIAHLLNSTQKGCTAFIGGIMTNTNSNFIMGKKMAPMVVEADEYDKSFMHLYPDITVITSLDPDHLDIYGDKTNMMNTYKEFVKKISKGGKVIINSKVGFKVNTENKCISYAIKDGDVMTEAIRIVNGTPVFTYRYGMKKIRDVHLTVPGYYNIENALAAITVAIETGMDEMEIKKRLKTYKGVKRRFEYVYENSNVTLIDDYAHHPMEIEAFLKSVRALSGSRKVTVIFQPHLYSRTHDFKNGFARVLDKADEIILLDIYPARELPIKGITSQSILDLMKNTNKKLVSKQNLIQELDNRPLDVVLTIGAGDIDREVGKIAYFLEHKFGNTKTEKKKIFI